MITELYADGGVIGHNPSSIGGTYAYLMIDENGNQDGRAKVITCQEMGSLVTNNQTEMLALLHGLQHLPQNFYGTIFSDSAVTLGRVFSGWRWKNIPDWMHQIYQQERRRLKRWDEIRYVLLDGHPTKAQLLSGIGKRGHPVSVHNVWCDEGCSLAAKRFMEAADLVPAAREISKQEREME